MAPDTPQPRIGFGYDLHRLEPGRRLVVGGAHIEHDRGAEAHSDGDVIYHAVTDAILGALAEPDIGELFPDSDPAWQNADSARFVQEACRRMHEAGYTLGNLDIVLILQRPKLGPHKTTIRQNLANLLHCQTHQINLKGKTHETVDALGENRALACHTAVLLLPVPGRS